MASTINNNIKIKAQSLGSFENIIRPLRGLSDLLFVSPADERIYPDDALALSIEKGGISSAYARRFLGKIKIHKLRYTALKDSDFAKPSDLLMEAQSAIKAFGLNSKSVLLSIPLEWVVFKRASLPSAAKESLATVLAYELDRLTPFSSDEAYYDYTVVSEEGNTINLALLSVRATAVKPYIDELKASNIQVSSITSNLSAPLHLIEERGIGDGFIYIGLKHSFVQTILVSKGIIQTAFKTDIDPSNHQSVMNVLLSQIEQCCVGSQKLQAILHMETPNEAIIEALKAKAPVVVKSSEQYLNQMNIADRRSIHAAGAAIEALKPKRSQRFNLLSKGNREKSKKPYLLTALLSITMAVLCVLYALSPIYIEVQKINKLSEMIESQKERLKKSEELKKNIDALKADIAKIEGFGSDTSDYLTIMKELTTIIPSSVWLTRVRITSKAVEIEGYAESTSGLLTRLEESKYFMNVEFSSPSYKDMSFKADRFTMKMQREDAKEEAKGEKK